MYKTTGSALLSTGFPALDAILGPGGLPRGASVALAGDATSGRTTLALRLAAEAQAWLVMHASWARAVSVAGTAGLPAWAWGALLATGYLAGELPNSFVKRQLDIAPGAGGRGAGHPLPATRPGGPRDGVHRGGLAAGASPGVLQHIRYKPVEGN